MERWLSYKGACHVILLAKLHDMYLYKTVTFPYKPLKSVSKVAFLHRFHCIWSSLSSIIQTGLDLYCLYKHSSDKMYFFNNKKKELTLLLARGDFCQTVWTFANSLDPDQARQNVGPDLDSNCLTL